MNPQLSVALDAGLAPLAADLGDLERSADTLRARSYTHPALPGRTVVELTGDAIAAGEDAALAFLGFEPPAVGEPLARNRRQGLGYPAWALVFDPEHADEALAVVKDMGRAARIAKSKPGNAEELYFELATRLPRQHLPAFWEQAARAMLAAGSARLAATFFGRAREVEDTHALRVDESARREAYLEFAFAGALTVKVIGAYATELAKRYEPAQAFAEFRELVVRRTRGGLPPWAELPAQMDKLARAAGLDVSGERAALAAELAPLPATKHAPAKVWLAWRKELIELARSDAAFRATLRDVFPAQVPAAQWFDLLERAGALAELRSGAGGSVARWITSAITFSRGTSWRTDHAAYDPLVALLPALAPVAAAQGGAVTLTGWRIDAALLDSLVADGFAIAPLPERCRLDLDSAIARPDDGRLQALAQHAEYGAMVDDAVAALADLDATLPLTALRPSLTRLLERKLSDLDGPLHQVLTALAYLESHAGRKCRAAFPRIVERVAATNVPEVLARTLRAGILDEYGWPALDEAVAELGADFTVTSSWPVLTLCSRYQAIAIGPAGRVAEHILRIPAKPGKKAPVEPLAFYSGGQFLIAWWQGEAGAYWSSRPADVMTRVDEQLANARYLSYSAPSLAILDDDGLRVGSTGTLQPGSLIEIGRRDVVSDGRSYWRPPTEWQATTLEEFDPVTGAGGRRSLPSFFEDAECPAGCTLNLASSYLLPLPAEITSSPFDGGGPWAGAVTFRSPDGGTGVRVTTSGLATSPNRFGVLSMPGGEALELGGSDLHSHLAAYADGRAAWVVRPHTFTPFTAPVAGVQWHAAAGTPYVPQLPYWHFLVLRDPAGSAVLRRVEAGQAGRWLAAVARAIGEGDGESPNLDEDAVAIAARAIAADMEIAGEDAFGSEPFARGVAGIVLAAIALQRRLAAFAAPPEQASGAQAIIDEIDAEQLSNVAGTWFGFWRVEGSLTAIAAASDFLAGRTSPKVASQATWQASHDWLPLLPGVGLLALRAASPGTAPAARAALIGLLRLWRATVFPALVAEAPGRLFLGHVELHDRDVRAVVGEDGAAIVTGSATWTNGKQTFGLIDVRAADRSIASKLGTVTELAAARCPWGRPAELDEAIARLESGPLDWDPAAVQSLADATGLPPAAAAVILAGAYAGFSYRSNDPVKSSLMREVTGLKATELKVGGATLEGFDGARRERAIASGASAIGQGSMADVAAAIGQAWVAEFGRAVNVDADLVAAATFRFPSGKPAAAALARLADPAADSDLGLGPQVGVDGPGKLAMTRLTGALNDLALAIPWAYQQVPLDHPILARASQARARALAAIDDPDLLLGLCATTMYGNERDQEAERIVRRFPDVSRGKDGALTGDDGLTMLLTEPGSYGRSLAFLFRPALPHDDPRWAFARAIAGPEEVAHSGQLRTVTRLRSEGFAAICARIDEARAGAIAGFDADPCVSAPQLVEKAAADLDVSEEAARYFLQLLAMAEPTDRHVKAWNGWSAAALSKARSELIDGGHVIQAKRARAGRSVFVPGDWWEADTPYVPIEAFKAQYYGAHRSGRKAKGSLPAFVPDRPLGEVFFDAWARRP